VSIMLLGSSKVIMPHGRKRVTVDGTKAKEQTEI